MEGSIKAGKKKIQSHKRAQFLYNLALYSLTSLITFSSFSYPFWLPSMKYLIFSLINSLPSLSNTKCFFLVGNLIVFVLIGESRFSHSSQALDVYDEYVARSQSYRSNKIGEERHKSIKKGCEERKEKILKVGKSGMQHQEKKNGTRVCKIEENGKREQIKGEKDQDQQIKMPREELNRRVEAYIARVNKQRFLEAKLVDQNRR